MVINLSLISMNKCVLSEIYNKERGVRERDEYLGERETWDGELFQSPCGRVLKGGGR